MKLNFSQKFLALFKRKHSKTTEVCLVLAKDKGHKELFSLPANFNLDAHITQFPPAAHGFPATMPFIKDKALMCLNLLSSIPARNSDLIDADGFIPIHIATARKDVDEVNFYLKYFVQTGVIVCRKQYIPGQKSRGYKWAPEYEKKEFTPHLLSCKYTERISLYNASGDQKIYPYLFYWYEQHKLAIDPLAESYAYAVKEMKMQDASKGSWDKNSDTGQLKYPISQYQAAIRNIGKIRFGRYEPHIDTNIHRLHSVLTNLQKDYRNFLSYDGKSLVSVDIKNCQPYLVCLILNPEFWRKNSTLPINLYNLPDNIITALHTPESLPIMMGNFFEQTAPEKFEPFIQLVASGEMYEKMADIANSRIQGLTTPISRKDAKILMFHLLFSRNRGTHKDVLIRQMRDIFEKELFPEVSELFRLIKSEHSDVDMDKQHNRLSCLLQSIESSIILHRCCRRIWEEQGHQVPIFTIHDSIVTIPEYKDYIVRVMKEEFSLCIGVPPTLSVEEWGIEGLNPDILRKITAV